MAFISDAQHIVIICTEWWEIWLIFYDSPLRAYPKLQAADAMRYNKMSILTISFPTKIKINVINENLN